jgi:hypothetical protein
MSGVLAAATVANTIDTTKPVKPTGNRERTLPLARPVTVATSGRIGVMCWLADFVADDAANGCTAHGTNGAAPGKDSTADRADAGTDGGVLVTGRHAGACAQAQQDCRGQRCSGKSFHRVHGLPLGVVNVD